MPETGGANIEVAHHLSEGHGHIPTHPSRVHEIMELALEQCAILTLNPRAREAMIR